MINICRTQCGPLSKQCRIHLAHSTMTGSKWMRWREVRRSSALNRILVRRNRFSRKGSPSRISEEPKERPSDCMVLLFLKFTSNLHWYPTDSQSVSWKARVTEAFGLSGSYSGGARYIDRSAAVALSQPVITSHCQPLPAIASHRKPSQVISSRPHHCAAIHGKH